MPLDRKTVDRRAAMHLNAMLQRGPVDQRTKREIRRMHERAAARVAAGKRR